MGVVEEHELAEGSGPQPSRPHAPRERRTGRRSRPWAWVAAAAVLVVGGAVAAPPGGTLVGRHTGGVAVGMLDIDLGRPPSEVWRSALTVTLEGDRVLRVLDDTLLTSGPDAIAGHALDDGELLWRVDGTALGCHGEDALVCVDRQGTADAEIVRVDLLAGERERVPAPWVWAAVDVGADVVVLRRSEATPGEAGAEDDLGTAELVRLAPDGQERWGAQAFISTPDDGRWAGRIQVDGEGVDVDGSSFDLADGTLLPPDDDGSRIDDRTVVRAVEDPSDGRFSVDVFVDGTLVATDQDVLMRPDDDLGGLLDLQLPDRTPGGDLVTAVRSDTAEELWSRTSSGGYPVARLDGVVVLSGSAQEGLVGLEARTGEQTWAAPATSYLGGDDDTLLVSSTDDGTLHALDVRTGDTRWTSVDGFFGTRLYTPEGIVVVSGQDLVRLDWPRR